MTAHHPVRDSYPSLVLLPNSFARRLLPLHMRRIALAAAAALVLAALVATPASATIGGDVSQLFSQETYNCVRGKGWDFAIVRSYLSYGAPDGNAPASLDRIKAAGIPYHDAYHFPCRGKSASAQVQEDVNAVGKDRFGTLWFDIETNPSPGCGWSGDLSSSCRR